MRRFAPRGHNGAGLAFSRDGHKIVSTSDDRDVRVWDATPLKK